jgi:hypothetical protein
MRQRADLIVPVKDRRQHKRYLTLKNFAIACGVAFVLFMIVTVLSETRGPAPDDYGRLVRREIPVTPVEAKPLDVVTEAPAPVDDQAYADPTLVQPMARQQQWMGNEPAKVAAVQPTTPPAGDDVAVEGGPEGVSVAKHRPLLKGGFGRTE